MNVLVADPSWLFGDALPGESRGASSQYPCMTTRDIARMQIPDVGPNAALFLWCVEAMQRDALQVVDAWGFEEKTSLIWEKTTSTGKPFFGMGRYTRASHERCILAVRGSAPVANHSVRSRFAAPVPTDAHGRYIHSAKPNAFYRIVTTLYPFAWGRRHFEMFARTVRPGWTQFGNQLGSIPEVRA